MFDLGQPYPRSALKALLATVDQNQRLSFLQFAVRGVKISRMTSCGATGTGGVGYLTVTMR